MFCRLHCIKQQLFKKTLLYFENLVPNESGELLTIQTIDELTVKHQIHLKLVTLVYFEFACELQML
jgi:hypothetical protein